MPQTLDIKPSADDPAFIRGPLVELVVPIDSLALDEQNVRVHNARNLATIASSLKRFGQYRPVVVQEEGRVVRAGNGTVMAARSLGWKRIAAVVLPMSEIDAAAFAIADNRAADLARWDEGMLGRLLAELQEVHAVAPVELDLLGWSADDLAAFPRDGDWVPPQATGSTPLEAHQRGEKAEAMRFEVTEEEREAIEECIARARIMMGLPDETDGGVFAQVCRDFLELGVGRD